MARFHCSLAFSILFVLIMSLSLVSSFNILIANSTYTSHASTIPLATLYMSPSKVAGLQNQTVTIKASITQVANLFAFQIGLRFDPNVTECLGIEDGGFLSNNGANSVIFFPGQIDNATGIFSYSAWTLTDATKARSGSGTLAEFTFRMKTPGYSDVHVLDFDAIDNTAVTQIPVKIVDSYTPLRAQSENSISITGNALYTSVVGPVTGYSAHSLKSLEDYRPFAEFDFNVTGFAVNGDSFAFCNVSIPKNFMWPDAKPLPFEGWYVQLNGNLSNVVKAVYENSTHTSVYFEFIYNDMIPTTEVRISTAINLERPYPIAELSISTDNWWYIRGEAVTLKARFTVNNTAVGNGTVTMKVVYPNMSIYLSYFNITEPNGNATFTIPLNQNLPFGNYSIQLLAGKLGFPGAFAVKYFWVWQTPLIKPYPRQYAYYRVSQYDTSNNLIGGGWFNSSYVGYFQPNLINCSITSVLSGGLGNQSNNAWVGVNTTTRWSPVGTVEVGNYFELWIQTNVTIGSQIRILNTMGTVTGSQILPFRQDDGTIGFVDTWKVEYIDAFASYTTYFDKLTGLNVHERVNVPMANTILYWKVSDTNIPIGYNWGDINRDQTVNATDAALMQNTWQSRTGMVNFNQAADFNFSGKVDASDAAIIGHNWQHRRNVLP